MKYIGTFREGDRVSDIYLCKQRQQAVSKSGKAYENVKLQDKTGIVKVPAVFRAFGNDFQETCQIAFLHYRRFGKEQVAVIAKLG